MDLRGIEQTNVTVIETRKPGRKTTNARRTLPWWWIFIAYIISFLFVGIAAFATIARSIELGDVKTQKWLASILTSFLSSVLLTEPMKVICFTVFIACLERNSADRDDDDEREATVQLDENEAVYLNDDEEYLQSMDNPLAAIRKKTRSIRLNQAQVAHARYIRLLDQLMWQAVREMLGFIFLALTIFTLSYLDRDPIASYQVTHLRNLFLNLGKANNDFTQVCPQSFFSGRSPTSRF